jgi:hypothetical protein
MSSTLATLSTKPNYRSCEQSSSLSGTLETLGVTLASYGRSLRLMNESVLLRSSGGSLRVSPNSPPTQLPPWAADLNNL